MHNRAFCRRKKLLCQVTSPEYNGQVVSRRNLGDILRAVGKWRMGILGGVEKIASLPGNAGLCTGTRMTQTPQNAVFLSRIFLWHPPQETRLRTISTATLATKAAAWLPALQGAALLGLRESYSRLFRIRRSSKCGTVASSHSLKNPHRYKNATGKTEFLTMPFFTTPVAGVLVSKLLPCNSTRIFSPLLRQIAPLSTSLLIFFLNRR